MAPSSGASPTPTAGASSDAGLERTLGAVRDAGIPGVYSAVRDGARRWAGAAGVADVRTGRPVRPGMAHRVGSVTKTFTAVGVSQQVGAWGRTPPTRR
ncbi:serine hydrolase [Streptomyces sp. NPDC127098]|uniref:serine hydrolase n=1 Tax=Streptomyces sp. NPDC127098 TaxID=3347137 RepID=UPI003651FEDF